jgi:prephenate dehydrogenase
MNVVVIGLGLIGGSIARDLAALGHRVKGADADPSTLGAAQADGVIALDLAPPPAQGEADSGPAGEPPGERRSGGRFAGAEVVILAVPVDRAPELLRQHASELAAVPLVMDTGSTKGEVVRTAREVGLGHNFVGAHPLAGDHRSGWTAGRRGLFAGERVYLCPSDPGSSSAPLALAFWDMLGAHPEMIDTDRHDAVLAWTSHLPQLTATALALTLAERGHGPGSLGRGGRDMTRLAGSDAAMWTGIARANAGELGRAMRALQARLDALRAALETDDGETLLAIFEAAREWYSSETPTVD